MGSIWYKPMGSVDGIYYLDGILTYLISRW